MKVEFGTMSKRRVIGEAESIDGCWKIIRQFLDDHKYKSYYQRIIEQDDGSLWIDVGSWTEFFWITAEARRLTINDAKYLQKIEAE